MAETESQAQEQLQQVVNYLRARRETLLNKWRTVCSQDQTLSRKTNFSREEFNDQIPCLLNILAQRLEGKPQESDPVMQASEHGLHRWQRGYSLSELLHEIEHLYLIIQDEVRAYQQSHPQLQAAVLDEVHRQVFKIFGETTRGSVLYYDQLRQTNAAGQLSSLQGALDELQQISTRRGQHLRQSSHDLRSSFGLLLGAASLLELPNIEAERGQLVAMLNRNLRAIHDMLLQLTDYARIEAGQEILNCKPVHVTTLLRSTLQQAQPLANERTLFLHGEGDESLTVISDPVKIQRILQNLLHNALKYTQTGGVYVSWAQENDTRWILSVQDTGPGFEADSPASVLAEQLRPLSQLTSTHRTGGQAEYSSVENPPTEAPKQRTSDHLKESEGLGLFIVKKLCELLQASMDIESAMGQGTLVRIRFLMNQDSSHLSSDS